MCTLDIIVLAARAMKIVGMLTQDENGLIPDSFRDSAKVSGYASEAVGVMIEKGYIVGSGGLLRPIEPVTRAEAAVLVYRMISK